MCSSSHSLSALQSFSGCAFQVMNRLISSFSICCRMFSFPVMQGSALGITICPIPVFQDNPTSCSLRDLRRDAHNIQNVLRIICWILHCTSHAVLPVETSATDVHSLIAQLRCCIRRGAPWKSDTHALVVSTQTIPKKTTMEILLGEHTTKFGRLNHNPSEGQSDSHQPMPEGIVIQTLEQTGVTISVKHGGFETLPPLRGVDVVAVLRSQPII